jgi:hypothetical protein
LERFRDMPPHALSISAKQAVALAAEVLGSDYAVLYAAIDRSWSNRWLGETEGFTDRASASACGKGMLRGALRNLSRFFLSLDRLEAGIERARDVWPLVGTSAWPTCGGSVTTAAGAAATWLEMKTRGYWLTSADRFLVEIAATLMARYRIDELKSGDVSLLIGLLGKVGFSPNERDKMNLPAKA